ncbi:hypothetical protein [Thermaurantimonas aggregans]|uniref:hypothetical protein n=1 Tax=Thermaurantimonas aggregans TaxID=2173829 RepID=UPI0023F4B2F5|nr:hypothetical protein [Thermaurantimonas aggregans]MCX8147865.1 hypothetical protein [Thermaurantimonas aggregans]
MKALYHLLLRELDLLLLLSLPTLIMFFLFYSTVQFYPSDERYPVAVLLQWIFDARPLIVFDYNFEKTFTKIIFYILIVMILFDLEKNIVKKTFCIQLSDVFLIPLFITFILYIFTPNGASAGMMSDRYALILFIFLLLWIVSRVKLTWIHPVLIVIAMFTHILLQLKHYNKDLWMLDKHARTLYAISEHIEENSIVLPINFSDHWMEIHFSNYIGCTKPLILLENYESTVNWFPVLLNYANLPNLFLHQRNFITGIEWKHNPDSENK